MFIYIFIYIFIVSIHNSTNSAINSSAICSMSVVNFNCFEEHPADAAGFSRGTQIVG